LLIEFKEPEGHKVRLALEDLAYLILDTPEVFLSGALLSAMSTHAVLVLGSDDRHMPAWCAFPWALHYRQGAVAQLQLNLTVPTKKRLWQRIVMEKLTAQARTLQAAGRDGALELLELAGSVRSGDPENLEARGAALYFSRLFGSMPFRRHDEDLPNALLDYGYALFRAALARHLCAHGFLPSLGIHHQSVSNAFNLADDLIEPFRPLVDATALRVLADRDGLDILTTSDRQKLVAIFEQPVLINGVEVNAFAAVPLVVQSLKRACEAGNPELLSFPVPIIE
jgi:CRISPR-associated protein Cas1